MPRNVGTITREAPPGPEMDEQEFADAMNDAADDAARWRYLVQNWDTMSFHLLNAQHGYDVVYYVDRERK